MMSDIIRRNEQRKNALAQLTVGVKCAKSVKSAMQKFA